MAENVLPIAASDLQGSPHAAERPEEAADEREADLADADNDEDA
jgi:hypothetical protein